MLQRIVTKWNDMVIRYMILHQMETRLLRSSHPKFAPTSHRRSVRPEISIPLVRQKYV